MAIVEKRGNSYSIRVSTGYSSNGKQIRTNFTWSPDPNMTERQIQKELNKQVVILEDRAAAGNLVDSKIKFSAFVEIWMKNHAEKHLAPKTVFEYSNLLVRINEAIGHIRLDKLQPLHLMSFYNNLAEEAVRGNQRLSPLPCLTKMVKEVSKSWEGFSKVSGISSRTVREACGGKCINEKSALAISNALGGKVTDYFVRLNNDKKLSGNTIQHYHRLISSILNTAVEWQVIAANPAGRVRAPKAEKHESKYLDEMQAQRVLELLDNESIQFRTMIILLIYSGARRGEIEGLQWPDIDFKHNLIHIRRVTQYIPHKGVFVKETKNEGSTRTIKISSIAFIALQQFKTWQDEERLRLGEAWQSKLREDARNKKEKYKRIEWIFTSCDGMPIFPDTITVQFRDFIERNELPYVGIHGLRHTNATLQIASGVNLRTVSGRLGHAQTSTTSNIYAHAIQSADAAAAETLENLLNPGNKPQINHKPG